MALTQKQSRLGFLIIGSHLGAMTAKKKGETYNYSHLLRWLVALGISAYKPNPELVKVANELGEKAKSSGKVEDIAAYKVAKKAEFDSACAEMNPKSFGSECSTFRNKEFRECFAVVDGKKVLSPIGKEILKLANEFLASDEVVKKVGSKEQLSTLDLPEATANRKGRNGMTLGGKPKSSGNVLHVGSIGFDDFI